MAVQDEAGLTGEPCPNRRSPVVTDCSQDHHFQGFSPQCEACIAGKSTVSTPALKIVNWPKA
jgi:hypothetical protein